MGFFKTQEELDVQKFQGKPVNAENLLQKAIRAAALTNPIGLTGTLGPSEALKTGFQTGQGVLGNLPQNIMENPKTFAQSGPFGTQALSGAVQGEDIRNAILPGRDTDLSKPEGGIFGQFGRSFSKAFLEPKTTQGKIAAGIGNLASGFIPLAAPQAIPKALSASGKAVGAISKPFRVKPIRQKMAAVGESVQQSVSSELKSKGKIQQANRVQSILKKRGATQARGIAKEGGRTVKSSVHEFFKKKNVEFGESFSKLDSKMTAKDIEDVLSSAASEIGAGDIPGSPAFNLLQNKGRYGVKKSSKISTITGEKAEIVKKYSKEQVQAITKAVRDSVGDERAKAIFNKHLLDKLSDAVPGLKELKASHAPIYKIARESKEVNQSSIGLVARGNIPATEVRRLSGIEKKIGSNFIEKAIQHQRKTGYQRRKLASRRGSEQRNIDKEILRREQLKQEIDKLQGNITATKWRQGVATGAGVLGGSRVLSKIFGFEGLKE